LVFVSHITREADLAAVLKAALDAAFLGALEVFVSSDASSIRGGARWLDRITAALTRCKVEIILLSAASLDRPWINFESGAGWVRGIPVIPVFHSGLTARDLRPPLSMLQGLRLTDPEALETMLFGTVAETAGLGVPSYDFRGLADSLRSIETELLSAPAADAAHAGLPEELGWSFARRLATLSPTQRQLLDRVTNAPMSSLSAGRETYYRLESLRLLGLLTRHGTGTMDEGDPIFEYTLSPDYELELGGPRRVAVPVGSRAAYLNRARDTPGGSGTR
jgi:hypothetical protein